MCIRDSHCAKHQAWRLHTVFSHLELLAALEADRSVLGCAGSLELDRVFLSSNRELSIDDDIRSLHFVRGHLPGDLWIGFSLESFAHVLVHCLVATVELSDWHCQRSGADHLRGCFISLGND